MINNIIVLGMKKPVPDRYLDVLLINKLSDIKPNNGCNKEQHHVVFPEYNITPYSSFFDVIPGICSCGIYWKKLAHNNESKLLDYYIQTGRIPARK